jgi:tetratricopeptide (TPR) repeat protein
MAAIFISHSSQDNEAAGRLKEWLGDIGFDQVFLDFDKHQGIPLGSDWESHLYREMERCQAVLLVLTSNWLDSKWCFAEFAQARALGKTVYVVLETPQGETAIARDLQVCDLIVDPVGGRDRLRLALQEALLVAQAGFVLPSNRAPYPGLVSFEAGDAAVFFGRDGEINGIFEWVRSERSRQKKALVILGGSGTGKSSLLKAGLLPRLERERDATGAATFIVVPPVRPGDSPMRELLAALRSIDKTLALTDLTAATTPTGARDLVDRLRDAVEAPRGVLVVAIDQAEELSVALDREQADAFAALLVALATGDTPARLLFTLRADHLEDIQRIEELADAIEVFPIKPMPIERLSEIVKGPARRVDLLVEDALVEAIKLDATSPDALPLVAFVLRELYDRYGRATQRLERVHYDAMRLGELSPLEAAVRLKAEETIGGVPEADLAALREAFVPGLVRINEEGSFVRRAALRSSLAEAARPLLEKLVSARLLVENRDERGARIEVAHEALFRVWPTLAGWLVEERDFLIGKSRIERLHEDYQRLPASDRDKGLLSGILLERARGWLNRYPQRFAPDEGAFIRRSARQAAVRALVARALFAAAIVLAIGLAGSGIWAWQQRGAAVAAKNEAEAQTRIAQAERARADKDFAAAKQAIDSLIFDVAQGLQDTTGVPVATIRRVLETVNETVGKLADNERDDKHVQRSRVAMLDDFARTYLKAGDLADAEVSAEQGLGIARELAKEGASADAESDLSAALDTMGDVKLRAGDRAGALAAYQEMVVICRQLASDKTDAQSQRDLARSLDKIGDVTLLTADRAGALAAYDESFAIRRELARDKADAYSQRDLALSLANRGAVRLLAGDRAAYEETLAIDRELAKDRGNAQAQNDLMVGLSKTGDVRTRAGDRQGALAAYEEMLVIGRELAKDKGNADAQRNLSLTLQRIADAQLQAGDREGAVAGYQESLAIDRERAKDKGDAQAARDLFLSLDKIGGVRLLAGDGEGALAADEESLAIARELAKDSGNAPAQQDLAGILAGLGDAKLQTGDRAGALAAYEESVAVRREQSKDKGNAEAQRYLSLSLTRIGDMKLQAGDYKGALAACEEVLAIAREQARDKGNAEAQRDLSVSLQRIGNAKSAADDRQGALAAFEEGLAINREMAKDKGNAEAQRDLAVDLGKIGDLKLQAGDHEGALVVDEESLAIFRDLANDKGDAAAQSDLSVSLGRIASVKLQAGDAPAALVAFEKMLAINRELANDKSNSDAQRNLAETLQQIGNVKLRLDDREGALAAYEKMLAINRELANDKSNTEAQRDLGGSLTQVGDVKLQLGDREGALAAHREMLTIDREIYSAMPTPEAKSDLVNALGALSLTLLVNQRAQEALDRAQEAHALDPAALWIETNHAHALLFLGRFDKAKAIYLSEKDKLVGDGQTFGQAVKDDFAMFRRFGIDLPAMKEIEALLSV